MTTKRFIYFSIEIFSEYSGIITDIFKGTLDELKKHLNIINYVVNWTAEHLTTRMYIFDENDILKEIRTINNY